MILDVGCGHLPTHHPHGTVNIDKEKPCWRVPNFIQADAYHLPIRQGSISRALCFQVIEHLENPTQLLREMKRVITYDGSVLVSTPNPLHWRRLIYALRNREVNTGFHEHLHCWTPHEFMNVAKHVGFTATSVWCDTPPALLQARGVRYMLDRVMRRVLPEQLGERHIWMEMKHGH